MSVAEWYIVALIALAFAFGWAGWRDHLNRGPARPRERQRDGWTLQTWHLPGHLRRDPEGIDPPEGQREDDDGEGKAGPA